MDNLDLRFYVWLFFRRLPFIVVLTAIGAAAGVMIALSLPSTYEAVAKILIEQPRISADVARTTIPVNAIEQVQIMEQQLTTRASLLEMARKHNVYGDEISPSDDGIVMDMQGRTHFEPLQFDTPGSSGSALAFTISFEATDPVLAADIANAYASAILETNARERRKRADEVMAFMRAEVDRLSTALSDAGDAIAHFKAAHQDALPDSLESRRMQEGNLEERLAAVRREEDQLRAKRITLTDIYTRASGSQSPGSATPQDALAEELKRSLAEQQTMFSENSPNIATLRQRIEALEAEAEERRTKSLSGETSAAMPSELQLQFAEIESRINSIGDERKLMEARLAALKHSIGVTAQTATELDRIERDYENTQIQYSSAAARLADASTGARIEQEAIGEKLSLIEPAVPPENPSNSKRKMVAFGGTAFGFMVSIGLLLVFEVWRAAVYRPTDIGRVYEGEPIGAIPFIPRNPASVGPRGQTTRSAAAVLLMHGLNGLRAIFHYFTPGRPTVDVKTRQPASGAAG